MRELLQWIRYEFFERKIDQRTSKINGPLAQRNTRAKGPFTKLAIFDSQFLWQDELNKQFLVLHMWHIVLSLACPISFLCTYSRVYTLIMRGV